MAPLGKVLVALGLMIAALGAILWSFGSVPYVGRLPGDFYVRRGDWSFYFPLTTCILLSIVLTIVFSLLGRR
jgi:ribose/xylose/arabinose/galactoside ABC-type transport system permease subunit